MISYRFIMDLGVVIIRRISVLRVSYYNFVNGIRQILREGVPSQRDLRFEVTNRTPLATFIMRLIRTNDRLTTTKAQDNGSSGQLNHQGVDILTRTLFTSSLFSVKEVAFSNTVNVSFSITFFRFISRRFDNQLSIVTHSSSAISKWSVVPRLISRTRSVRVVDSTMITTSFVTFSVPHVCAGRGFHLIF